MYSPAISSKARVIIRAGTTMEGAPETLESLTVHAGESIAVVGPTGSGKSQLLSDIEQLAEADTASGRRIILDSFDEPERLYGNVAHLTQKTAFLMDSRVTDFLSVHARSRGLESSAIVEKVIETANTLCGEPIKATDRIQVLSGGQSRALMIADIALISNAPIMLIDEIENAGIDKLKAISTLTDHNKVVFISTHDPILILMAHRRVVMKKGGMHSLLERSGEETYHLSHLKAMDDELTRVRDLLRKGESLKRTNSIQTI